MSLNTTENTVTENTVTETTDNTGSITNNSEDTNNVYKLTEDEANKIRAPPTSLANTLSKKRKKEKKEKKEETHQENQALPLPKFIDNIKHSTLDNLTRSTSSNLAECDDDNCQFPHHKMNQSMSGTKTPLSKRLENILPEDNALAKMFVDIPFDEKHTLVRKTEREFLIRVMLLAAISKQATSKRVSSFKFYNKILGTLAMIFGILGGSTGIGSLLMADPDEGGFVPLVVITIISILAAIFSTAQRSFGFEGKAVAFKQSSTEYGAIVTEIAHFLTTPQDDRKQIELFTNNIVVKLGVVEGNEEI